MRRRHNRVVESTEVWMDPTKTLRIMRQHNGAAEVLWVECLEQVKEPCKHCRSGLIPVKARVKTFWSSDVTHHDEITAWKGYALHLRNPRSPRKSGG